MRSWEIVAPRVADDRLPTTLIGSRPDDVKVRLSSSSYSGNARDKHRALCFIVFPPEKVFQA